MPTQPVRAPDIVELETLVTCAAEGSLAGAARQLGVSRPAVAKRIANLEALAGHRLLTRNGRGVALTEQGAMVMSAARRVLEERDAMMAELAEIRGDGRSAMQGLRELIGHAPGSSRAAQRPEALLSETERLLELVLQESSTAVVVSDPETSAVLEVNDAFCRFAGRSREALVGKRSLEIGSWQDPAERERMLDAVRADGVAENVIVRAARPDGRVGTGEATARLLTMSGRSVLVTTVEDTTERRLLDLELKGTRAAYRAIAKLSAALSRGETLLAGIGSTLPELRECGGFATALIWDPHARCPTIADGDLELDGLESALAGGEPVEGAAAQRFELLRDGQPRAGWAVPLGAGAGVLVLIAERRLQESARRLVGQVLADLTAVVQGSAAA